jgi:hypothetical protein
MPTYIHLFNMYSHLQNGEQFFIETTTFFGYPVEKEVRLVINSNNEIWYTYCNSWFTGWYKPTTTDDEGLIYVDGQPVYIT